MPPKSTKAAPQPSEEVPVSDELDTSEVDALTASADEEEQRRDGVDEISGGPDLEEPEPEEEPAAEEEPIEEAPAPPPPPKAVPKPVAKAPAKAPQAVKPPAKPAPAAAPKPPAKPVAKAAPAPAKPAPKSVAAPAKKQSETPKEHVRRTEAAQTTVAAFEETGWDDDPPRGGQFLRRFKGKKGFRDRIRAIRCPLPGQPGEYRKLPVKIKSHYNNKLRKFANCTQRPDCPACNDPAWKEYPSRFSYAMPIFHLDRRQKDQVEAVNLLHNWIFGGDKFLAIKDGIVVELADKNPPQTIYGREMLVSCQETDKQKLTIGLADENKMTKSQMQEALQEVEKFNTWLAEEFTPDAISASMVRTGTKRGPSAQERESFDADSAAPESDAGHDLDDLVGELPE